MFKTDVTIRKIRKPLMEKKRRARINDSLETLKDILLKNTVAITQGTRPTKLEKADILEMTVRYLQALQTRLIAQNKAKNSDCVTSTTTTFNENALQLYQYGEDRYPIHNRISASSTVNCSGDDKENQIPFIQRDGQRSQSSKSNSRIPSSRSAFSTINKRIGNASINNEQQVIDRMWRPW